MKLKKQKKIYFEISNKKLTENEIEILLKNNSESKVLFKKKIFQPNTISFSYCIF